MAKVRLRSLKLTGFKSFPDTVELGFPGRVSSIIGPNGCGKSNIVDALLWVLGEQSPSLMRLKNMGDVVFNGARGRAPAGAAEVAIELESDDGHWAASGGRMEIRRRVYRSGPSEYRINGKVARLTDVADELLTVGLGTRNYSIIEQGRVGQVLSARPTDRRVLIEEAAGITRYKKRKHEAELKLEHTRQNLQRLDDVIAEVQRSLRQVKRQASAAKRFEALQVELKDRLRRLHTIEAHTLDMSSGARSSNGAVSPRTRSPRPPPPSAAPMPISPRPARSSRPVTPRSTRRRTRSPSSPGRASDSRRFSSGRPISSTISAVRWSAPDTIAAPSNRGGRSSTSGLPKPQARSRSATPN